MQTLSIKGIIYLKKNDHDIDFLKTIVEDKNTESFL